MLLVGGIAAAPILAQTSAQLLEARRAREIADTRNAIELRAKERRAAIAAAWSRVNSCPDIRAFERNYDESGYGKQIAAARQRYCISRPGVAVVGTTPVQMPTRSTLSGFATPSGQSKVEILIEGRRVRLAQVMDCNPGSGFGLSELLAKYPLICRPNGEDYRCILRDTGEDVASVAVANGIAQPRGEEYMNEFWEWRKDADKDLPKGSPSRQCASGR